MKNIHLQWAIGLIFIVELEGFHVCLAIYLHIM